MRILRKLLFALYLLVLACMGAATIIEKYEGSGFVSSHVYGAWWFSALWALLAALAIVYFVKRKVKRPSTVFLHLSFVVILAGALVTHVSAKRGVIHLRKGVPSATCLVNSGENGVGERQLPFQLKLNDFLVKYHDGTRAVADYESRIEVIEAGMKKTAATVSMNNIFSYRSYRFYQSSYDADFGGSVLAVNSDPFGIPVTYTGYILLFVSLIWALFDPQGAYRRLLRNDTLKKGTLALAMVFLSASANAANVLPKETAKRFGELNILYNDRICPLQTFAIDFTKKLCGRASYNGYTAEQVLSGFIFWGDEWSDENILKVKGSELRKKLGLPKYASFNSFFDRNMGGRYLLGQYVQEYYNGNHDSFHKQAADVDDRLQLILSLRRGTLLKIFPVADGNSVTWYAPTDKLDTAAAMTSGQKAFVANVFSLIYQDVKKSDYASVDHVLGKIAKYQRKCGGASLPSPRQAFAERCYNAVPFATILFVVNLTMAFFSLFMFSGRGKSVEVVARAVLAVSFLSLTLCLALRWTIKGTAPMANGYETMLMMAWIVMLASLVFSRKMRIVLSFGLLMSGFMMLVSHISQMDPQISHIMPVLNSPLLSVHVSVIMMSFALLSLTFICALTAVALHLFGRHGSETSLMRLSLMFLYPALAALGIGIFVGAIWANVSWGSYWGWDPKEVWALITFMVYAIGIHGNSIPRLSKPMAYHVFMLFAFLCIMITYFGVNFFLGGMHSYA